MLLSCALRGGGFGREIVSGARYEDLENTPFTSDEQAEIVEQLRRINELMKRRYSLSEAQMQSLDAKLDSVKTAAGRIGRKDWVFLFYGVIFNMFVTALLPRETVWDILIRTLDALRDLFGGGLLPQLPPMA